MATITGLSIRQHVRERVELPVEFVVLEPHRDQVRFSSRSSAVDGHTVRGTATDLSRGGLGFECRQFLPRMCEGQVRVFAPSSGYQDEPRFTATVKVRRMQMTDHEPSYTFGLAFLDSDADLAAQIDDLLEEMNAVAESPDDPPEASHA